MALDTRTVLNTEFGLEPAPSLSFFGLKMHAWTYTHSALMDRVAKIKSRFTYEASLQLGIALYSRAEILAAGWMPDDLTKAYLLWQCLPYEAFAKVQNSYEVLVPNYDRIYDEVSASSGQYDYLLQAKDFPQNVFTLSILEILHSRQKDREFDRLDKSLGVLWTADMFKGSDAGGPAILSERAYLPLAMALQKDGGVHLKKEMSKRVSAAARSMDDENDPRFLQPKDKAAEDKPKPKPVELDKVGPTVTKEGTRAESLVAIPREQFKEMMYDLNANGVQRAGTFTSGDKKQ